MLDFVLFLHSIYCTLFYILFFFNDTATTEIYTLSLHDALPISWTPIKRHVLVQRFASADDPDLEGYWAARKRSEEHTSELQSRGHLVCRLLLEKKKKKTKNKTTC